MKVLLIRHAQSEANASGKIAGHINSPLSEAGRKACESRSRKKYFQGYEIVYSSDLNRAYDTAKVIFSGQASIQSTANLRERNFGIWNGISKKQIYQMNSHLLKSWMIQPPQGESLIEVGLRVFNWLALNINTKQNVVIVSHHGPLRIIMGLIQNKSWEDIPNIQIDNLEPLEFKVNPDFWGNMHKKLIEFKRKKTTDAI